MARKFAPPRKMLFIALAVLALLVGITAIYFQSVKWRELETAVADEKLAISTAQARLNQLIIHRNNAPAYRQRLEDVQRMIPAAPGEEEILRYINQMAGDYDLRAPEIRFEGRIDDGAGYINMPLALTLVGSYTDIMMFLSRLRDGERAIRVDNINITRTGAEGSELRIAITANAFHKPAE